MLFWKNQKILVVLSTYITVCPIFDEIDYNKAIRKTYVSTRTTWKKRRVFALKKFKFQNEEWKIFDLKGWDKVLNNMQLNRINKKFLEFYSKEKESESSNSS